MVHRLSQFGAQCGPGLRSDHAVRRDAVFLLKSGDGDVGRRSVLAIDGDAVACTAQGPLNGGDVLPTERRPLERELPGELSCRRGATKRPVGCWSDRAISWESVDSLKRPDGSFHGAPENAIDTNGEVMAAQQLLELDHFRSSERRMLQS